MIQVAVNSSYLSVSDHSERIVILRIFFSSKEEYSVFFIRVHTQTFGLPLRLAFEIILFIYVRKQNIQSFFSNLKQKKHKF